MSVSQLNLLHERMLRTYMISVALSDFFDYSRCL